MRIFFVMALGRSGTNFLAELLAQDRRGVVHHEPYPYDARLINLRHSGAFDEVLDQLMEQRFRKLLPAAGQAEFYGEINSYLRYEVDWLRRRFDPLMIHLVRDGRDFVRSAYIREVFTPYELDGPVLPRDDDPLAPRWGELSRFEKLCWYWDHTNRHLAERIERRVRFEDLIRDYDCLRREILEPSGVQVSRETWQQEIGRPRNTSRTFALRKRVKRWLGVQRQGPEIPPLPRWSELDEEQQARFWEICGETMERMGYRR